MIKQLTDAVDTVDDGQAIKNFITELKKAGDAADDTAEDISEIIDALKHFGMIV